MLLSELLVPAVSQFFLFANLRLKDQPTLQCCCYFYGIKHSNLRVRKLGSLSVNMALTPVLSPL